MDIFKQAAPMSTSWFYFKEVGDAVQGTYVGKVLGQKDNFGNEQIIYELLGKNGINKVGFRVSQKINEDMERVNLGQIIGFKYANRGKFFNKSLKKEQEFKNIQLWQDAKIVDQEWIDANRNSMKVEPRLDNTSADGIPDESIEADGEVDMDKEFANFGNSEAPVPVAEPIKEKSNAELLVEIASLAKEKLGVIEAKKVKDAVMEATGLAFISANYSKIITALKTI